MRNGRIREEFGQTHARIDESLAEKRTTGNYMFTYSFQWLRVTLIQRTTCSHIDRISAKAFRDVDFLTSGLIKAHRDKVIDIDTDVSLRYANVMLSTLRSRNDNIWDVDVSCGTFPNSDPSRDGNNLTLYR